MGCFDSSRDSDLDGVPAEIDCDDHDPEERRSVREGCSPEIALDADRDGHASSADCNDRDPEVFPGRDEVPNDGIDQDCDGEDLVDLDRDGWSVSEGDCADYDPTIHPGAVDVCDDGVDDDCDGVALACGTLDLDRTVVHLGTSVLLGMRVTRLWTEEP